MTTKLLDETGLGDFIDAHYREPGDQLFRMEQLPHYDVPHQAAELEAWRSGGEPDWATRQPWLDALAEEQSNGLISQRVRVFSEELTEDERRAIAWGYPYTSRYEETRVLHRGEHVVPSELIGRDYWLVGQRVVLMHYSATGAFEGAEVLPPSELARFHRDRDFAWAVAEPFGIWLKRHSELHRQRAA
jgi:hypothetical protein